MASDRPPSEYKLSDVVFEYRTSAGSWFPAEGTLVRVGGDGKGFRRTTFTLAEPEVQTFDVEPKKIFDVLDRCYQQGFFDLRPMHSGQERVRLEPDGKVHLLVTVAADAAGGRSVTLRIGAYEKRVGFMSAAGPIPTILDHLASEIESMVPLPGTK